MPHKIGKKKHTHIFTLYLFFWLVIYSQKAIKKIESPKIKCFLKIVFDSHNSNFKNKKSPDFYTWFKYVSQKYRRILKK